MTPEVFSPQVALSLFLQLPSLSQKKKNLLSEIDNFLNSFSFWQKQPLWPRASKSLHRTS